MYINNGHEQFFLRHPLPSVFSLCVFTVYLRSSHPLRLTVPCWVAFLLKARGLLPRNPCKLKVLHCPWCWFQAGVSVQARGHSGENTGNMAQGAGQSSH